MRCDALTAGIRLRWYHIIEVVLFAHNMSGSNVAG